MNLKKAKKLRLLTKQLLAKGVITGDWCRYIAQRHLDQQINTGKVDKDGKPIIVSVPRESRLLDPVCPRGVYQRMKKHGIASVLAGKA